MHAWVAWAVLACWAAAAGQAAAATPPPAPATASPAPAPAVNDAASSSAGQRLYARNRGRLLQVRTLLKTQDSQRAVGSGFLVSEAGHLITNFHVVSDHALHPQRYRLVYTDADGRQGALRLLAIDVVHDLALLQPLEPQAFQGRGVIGFRADEPPRGARIQAMGNPLDVGFAVMEGSYNGLTERSFVPTLFFGGSLSGGMSGGPAVDEQGRLVGVNVATRRDGQQVSFLVPAVYAQALLARGQAAAPLALPAWAEVSRQLLAHQAELARRFVAQPWRDAGHARYRIPLPQEQFMRCWGADGEQGDSGGHGLKSERSFCRMDAEVYVSSSLQTVSLRAQHTVYDGQRLGALRFAHRYASAFSNEFQGRSTPQHTAARCREDTVDRAGLPLRAVVCVRAYKRLPGLYDASVIVATLDQATEGVQGRFDASGVSFDNAQALVRHYIEGFAWNARKTASR